MVGHTFVVEKLCPICEKMTRVVKTRSRIPVTRRDEDACTHYRDFNPYYYTVWVCEHCGFAADETTFTTKMPDRYLAILRSVLLSRKINIPFTETRTLGNATTAFRLALKFLDILKGKSSKKAKYAHQLAWIYRDSEEHEDDEKEFMLKAAQFYEIALAKEHFPIGELTDNATIYLIAAIYYRLGDWQKATSFLSRLIGDQTVRQREPRIYDKARDLWGEIRASKKNPVKKGIILK
ncbi:MAG: DUF2225 domain-containing protein [Selenomonadaceae bacterium]|nr:DUF2225 domain-containing protein [Selenomonadaceae bacterium]